MTELGIVESTLFVPMIGRIYVSENCRDVLYDEKALELKEMLPAGLLEQNMETQNEYTLVASASRSVNMDRHIKDFLCRKQNGVIVQLGCGLETTYFRNDNGRTKWYSVDLPDVIAYRKKLIAESEREIYIAGDAFDDTWIKQIREEVSDVPLLVIASGLFYYFEEYRILNLFRMLQKYGEIEVVFDTVNKAGMTMMRKKYMKQVGHENATMFFYVDSAESLVAKISGEIRIIAEEKYYQHIKKDKLKIFTKINMNASDLLGMVKMVHLSLNEIVRDVLI